MDFTTVMTTRRSVREYADQTVGDDLLDKVCEAARLAPSACNFQPWRFVVVKDAPRRAQLVKLIPGQPFVATAPVLIVCCGKRYPQNYNWMGDHLFLIDVGIAIEHLVLAARNEGLGTCWIGGFEDKAIKTLLEIPADHDVIMVLTLGYPRSPEQFAPISDRLPREQIVFSECFGKPVGK